MPKTTSTEMVSPEDLRRAADFLRSGRLVAFPTETVYGLGANALDPEAVDRIYAAKGRPATSPLIVHVDSPEMARQVVSRWPNEASQLASRFWPGPLTLVLPKQPHVPDRVTAGLPTVGVRVPAHPVALQLIRAAGVPIAAPSANRFTELSPTTAEHVKRGLGSAVDMVLDGGPTQVGIESTVLSLAGEALLLRPGMVSQTEIEDIIGPVRRVSESGEGAHAAPGLHPRHYSPRTPLAVGDPVPGRSVWVYRTDLRGAAHSVRMPDEPDEYARGLYEVLHRLDSEGWESIRVEPLPETQEWDGIRDRLKRAATQD